MKTVPLRGKVAAGRVALVDDEDYDLVMQHRWHVHEVKRPGKRTLGPYAVTKVGSVRAGTRTSLGMHNLIMGVKGVDHRDHYGLNNQRYNLRPATEQQNLRNARGQLGVTSEYKGVFWDTQKRRWHAVIAVDRRTRNLGFYTSEIEAALAYDAAALEFFGEFACPNFPDGVPQDIRDQLRAEREATVALATAEAKRLQRAGAANWWAQRTPETRVCTICGADYLTKQPGPTLYCSEACCAKAARRRKRQSQLEGRLF